MNMKFWCLFSRSVSISLGKWHLEQRINPDGAFHIFCHANCFKRYVALPTSCVHCAKTIVPHAHIIYMPCVYFLGVTPGQEGDRERTGYDFSYGLKIVHAQHDTQHVIFSLPAQHAIFCFHAQHVIFSLHAQHVISSLHAQYVILSLHAQHVILSLHAQHVILSLHAQHVILSLHAHFVILSLHAQHVILSLNAV